MFQTLLALFGLTVDFTIVPSYKTKGQIWVDLLQILEGNQCHIGSNGRRTKYIRSDKSFVDCRFDFRVFITELGLISSKTINKEIKR